MSTRLVLRDQEDVSRRAWKPSFHGLRPGPPLLHQWLSRCCVGSLLVHPVKSWICLIVSSSPFLNIILYTWNFFPHKFIEKLTLPSGTKITAYASSGGWKEVQNKANLPIMDMWKQRDICEQGCWERQPTWPFSLGRGNAGQGTRGTRSA